MQREKFDLHCHTREGSPDAHVPLSQYATILKEKGYTGMLVTDHDSYNGYNKYDENRDVFNIPDDFVILKGIEYDTKTAGHIIVIMPDGVDSNFLQIKGLLPNELEEEVHKRGGILGCAHPYMPGCWSYGNTRFAKVNKNFAKKFDFIETYNGTINPILNLRAEAMAAFYGKPGTGGSDAHFIPSVGTGFARFPDGVEIKCNNDLIDAIKNAEHAVTGGEITDKMFKQKNKMIQKIIDGSFWIYNFVGAYMNKGLLYGFLNGELDVEEYFKSEKRKKKAIKKKVTKLQKAVRKKEKIEKKIMKVKKKIRREAGKQKTVKFKKYKKISA